MRKSGRIIAISLAATMALSLAACAQHPALKDKDAFVEAASENNKKITSYDVEGSAELQHKNGTTQEKKSFTINNSVFLETKEFSSVVKTEIAGRRAVPNRETYLKADEEGNRVLYTLSSNKWAGKPVASDEDAAADLAAVVGSDPAMLGSTFAKDNMDKFAIVDSDVIGGLSTSVLESKLTGEALIAFVKANDVAKFFNADALTALVTETYEGSVDVRVWVIDSSLRVAKVTADMTTVANDYAKAAATKKVADAKGSETAQAAAANQASVSKYTVAFTIKNMNRATNVTVPAAGLKAVVNPTGEVKLADPTTEPTATPAPSATADPSPSPAVTEPATDAAATTAPEADAVVSPSPSATTAPASK